MAYIGSQNRDTLEDAGLEVVALHPDGRAILKEMETGKLELWARHDDHAGYVVEINGVGYEFVRSGSR